MTLSSSEIFSTKIENAIYQTLLKRLPPKTSSPHLEDIINLLVNALSTGEIYVPLDEFPIKDLKAEGWPNAHYQALQNSGWLDSENSPIILKGNKICLRRWHHEITKAIKALQQKALMPPNTTKNKVAKDSSNTFKFLNQEQIKAVKAVEEHNLILLSGGPGTGKTMTIVCMIQRALNLNNHLKIGLAAPTGKATRRLINAIEENIKTYSASIDNNLSTVTCKTLHSWLEATDHGYRRNRQNPLRLDLLIIDEMSMVDLELMDGILDALPRSSQLVLVGDPNQLPPIGSGSIWHYLHNSELQKDFLNSKISLSIVYRNQGEIAILNKVLRTQGYYEFWEELANVKNSANVSSYISNENSIPQILLKHLRTHHNHLKYLSEELIHVPKDQINNIFEDSENFIKSGTSVLSYIDESMVLCPRRNGYWGVNHIHESILGSNYRKDIFLWPCGTPVMCGANQPELGLSNGDIGVLIGKEDCLRLLFRTFSNTQRIKLKLIHPARIKILEPAFALTIHKSQGSEASQVFLLWPNFLEASYAKSNEKNPINNNVSSLLYTAITRARKSLYIFTSQAHKEM